MAIKQLTIRFYEELNDFLPKEKRKKDCTYHFYGNPAIKDVIESFHIPHTEVDLVIVNGISVGFDYKVADGERIAVYPIFEGLDISPLCKLRPKPLRKTAFILDVHLGKLARYLRLLGFDCHFDTGLDDIQIIRLALKENRIILTRDIGLLKHSCVTHGYWIRSQQPVKQLEEVVRRFDLSAQIKPFSRCSLCNAVVKKVDKKKIEELLDLNTRTYFNHFFQCDGCGQLYWEGSHFHNIRTLADMIKKLC
jgi:uncharacterized protein with PIN domain